MSLVRNLVAGLVAVLVFAAGATSATADTAPGSVVRPNSVSGNNIDSWCSGGRGSDASCTLIRKRRGRFIVAWATSRSSVHRYRICLRNPRGRKRCVRRPMQKTNRDGIWADGFWLNREFQTNRSGRYGVSWVANGRRVGPLLHFRIR